MHKTFIQKERGVREVHRLSVPATQMLEMSEKVAQVSKKFSFYMAEIPYLLALHLHHLFHTASKESFAEI